MKKILLLGVLSTFSMADMFLGGEINIGAYTHSPKGFISFQGTNIDIVDTLKWENETDVFASFYFEHPIPIIPNIKLGYSTLVHNGAGGVDKEFEFAGKRFKEGFSITTGIDIKMLDATLYYELLDNWISVDFGVTAKYIEGNSYIYSKRDVLDESTDFKVVMPLAYSKIRFEIPTTDIALQVEGNYLTYNGDILYDVEAGIRYTVLLGVGAEVGFKSTKLKIDDIEGFNIDSDFSGVYGKLVWDF